MSSTPRLELLGRRQHAHLLLGCPLLGPAGGANFFSSDGGVMAATLFAARNQSRQRRLGHSHLPGQCRGTHRVRAHFPLHHLRLECVCVRHCYRLRSPPSGGQLGPSAEATSSLTQGAAPKGWHPLTGLLQEPAVRQRRRKGAPDGEGPERRPEAALSRPWLRQPRRRWRPAMDGVPPPYGVVTRREALRAHRVSLRHKKHNYRSGMSSGPPAFLAALIGPEGCAVRPCCMFSPAPIMMPGVKGRQGCRMPVFTVGGQSSLGIV